MKHAYLIALLLLCTTHSLSAQPAFRGTAVTPSSPEAFSRHFSDYHLFQIDAPALNRYAKHTSGAFQLDLELGNAYHWKIALQAHDIRSENYRLVAATPRGDEVQPRTPNKTFKGSALGPQGGEARLALDEHFIYGFVEIGQETYYIEPAWYFDSGLEEDTYLAYPVSAVISTDTYTCAWEGGLSPDVHELPAPEAGRFVLACYQVDVALAADFSMVQRFGSVNGAESFMLGVLNNVQSNYDNEFAHQIFFAVATLYVSSCSSCNPWTSSLNSGVLLDDFTDWGNGGGFGVSFDVASLWSDRNFNGDAIGVAWVGGLCSNGRYNVLENFVTNSALLRVLQAHEIGHNFNAGHDAQGSNFIMAPSVNNTNSWSNNSVSAINSFVNAISGAPGCLSPCGGNIDPPTPALTASATTGCAPLSVQFTDLSSGQVNNISWQFPGGTPTTSTNASPTVTYNNTGTFDVILTVSNSGGSNTITMEDYIVVDQAPEPQFSFTIDGLNVFFDNATTNAQSYQWDFDDGNYSNTPFPGHTYATDGAYLVSLTASNSCGSATAEEYVIVESPMQAAFSANTQLGCAGLRVSFTDQSTGAPVDWNWSFDGGTPATSTAANPTVTYETPGVYNVSLTVSNVLGTTSTSVQPTYVEVLPSPEAAFTYQYAPGGLSVQFNNASSGVDGWFWDFGDGATSNLENPGHTYTTDGNYSVTLTVFGPCGDDVFVQNIEVATPPSAAFSANVLSGCAPLMVQFGNESSDNATTFQWSFQGGTPATSTLPDPVITFNAAGTYSVRLISGNAAGSDTTTQSLTIEAGPQSAFDINYTIGDTEASFENQSANADSLNWIFPDGTTRTGNNPGYDFGADGTYPVTLIAFNDCGSDTLVQQVEIITAPTADFELDAVIGCTPFTVQANDLSSNNTTEWAWSAPGATPDTSDVPNPSFTYTTPGAYTITLVGANAAGTSTASLTVNVGDLPEAAFAAATTLGSTSLSLSNTSIDADSYAWDFGDGSTSNETEPAHTYAQDGAYTVQLIATNPCGNDTTSQEVVIITAPAADFELDAVTGCTPFTVQVNDLSSNNTTGWNWSAPGAIPATSNEQSPSFTYTAPGAYTLTLETSNGAGTSTASVSINVGDLPEAAFAAATTLGVTDISLSNTSLDANSYAWDFGDGSTSAETEPAHTYAQDGVYTVQLIATNTCGNDTTSQEVTVITKPTADFEMDATTGCAPFTVQVNDLSSDNTTEWNWSAPGATPATSDEQHPGFIYATPGAYIITLVASNAAGMSTSSLSVSVGGLPDAAFAAANTLGSTSLSLSNTSIDADSYAWDFGDGSISTETEPAHTYAQDGVYTVQLIATNPCGNDTTSQEVTVITVPAAGFELDATAGCTPFTVQVNDLSSDNTTEWNWSAPGAAPATSDEQNPSFTFALPGTYTITLEASNAAGASLDSVEVFINSGPTPDFTFQVNGLEAQFTNTSANGLDYLWDFGDGSTSEGFSPGHTYETPGEYIVSLTATNECGMATTTNTVTLNLSAPVASFTVAGSQGCAPLVVSFTNNSENAENLSWSFPGGTPSSSNETNPTVTYETPGLFSATLVASNAAGSGALTLQNVILVGGPPQGSFEYTIEEATVMFTNTTENADNYTWLFGDGNTSNSPDPEHTYSQGGDYSITLLATNECGTDTLEQMITLSGAAPTPNLSASIDTGCAPLSVTFDGGVPGTVTNWQWAFPGGMPDSSTEPNPTVVYQQPGMYDVNLTVGNAFGENSQEETGLITVVGIPEASFTYDIQELSLLLANTSTGEGLSYSWDFGDGNGSEEENPQHTYAEAGEYTVVLTVSNACGESILETKVVAVISGVADESWLEALSLFPNPNSGAFTVRLQGQPAEVLQLSLLNVVGQRLFSLKDSFRSGYWQRSLELGQLPAGVYVLEVLAGERRAYRRVVVE